MDTIEQMQTKLGLTAEDIVEGQVVTLVESEEALVAEAPVVEEAPTVEEAPVVEAPVKPKVDLLEGKSEQEIEDEAKSMGWKPDGPKSAAEFVRTAPLYDALSKNNKKIKELEASLHDLKELSLKQQEVGYRKALKDLETKRREAISLGDADLVDQLEAEIQVVKKEEKPPEELPEVQQFKEKHSSWIKGNTQRDIDIKTYVTQRDIELGALNLTPAEHLHILDEDLKYKFGVGAPKEKAEPPRAVETDRSPVNVHTRKKGFNDLNTTQKEICRRFTKQGLMSTEEYINSLTDLGEL